MKHPKTRIGLAIGFSVILFLFGVFFYGQYIELLLPKVEGGFYPVTEYSSGFRSALLFSLVISLIPISLYLLWRLSPKTSSNKKLVSIFVIIGCIALAIICRQFMIQSYFTNILTNSASGKLTAAYPMSEVHFEYYALLGLCIGCSITFFILRIKKS